MVFPADAVIPDSGGVTLPPDFSESDREIALAARYKRRNIFQEKLVFEFTREPDFLHQYYKLRAREYEAVHGVVDFPSNEGEDDRGSHIMVVRSGNFCVGGMRLNVKTPRVPKLLPMEIEDFRLENHFPQLRHKNYGQIGATVVLPEFRGGDVTLEMFRRLYRKVVALNLCMTFAVAPKLIARYDRQSAIAIGLKEAKIHYDIKLPTYPHVAEFENCLLSIVINKGITENFIDHTTKERNYESVEYNY